MWAMTWYILVKHFIYIFFFVFLFSFLPITHTLYLWQIPHFIEMRCVCVLTVFICMWQILIWKQSDGAARKRRTYTYFTETQRALPPSNVATWWNSLRSFWCETILRFADDRPSRILFFPVLIIFKAKL